MPSLPLYRQRPHYGLPTWITILAIFLVFTLAPILISSAIAPTNAPTDNDEGMASQPLVLATADESLIVEVGYSHDEPVMCMMTAYGDGSENHADRDSLLSYDCDGVLVTSTTVPGVVDSDEEFLQVAQELIDSSDMPVADQINTASVRVEGGLRRLAIADTYVLAAPSASTDSSSTLVVEVAGENPQSRALADQIARQLLANTGNTKE